MSEMILPEVYLLEDAAKKLRAYIDCAKDEISGMGTVEVIEGDFYVKDVFIIEQDSGSAHSDFEEEAVAKFMEELILAGREDELNEMTLWWHSHVKMSAYFSLTDTGTMDKWKDEGWLLSLVGNKHGEWRARIDWYDPRLYVDGLDVHIVSEPSKSLIEEVQKEIAEKVKKKPVVWGTWANTGKNGKWQYVSGPPTTKEPQSEALSEAISVGWEGSWTYDEGPEVITQAELLDWDYVSEFGLTPEEEEEEKKLIAMTEEEWEQWMMDEGWLFSSSKEDEEDEVEVLESYGLIIPKGLILPKDKEGK